MDKYSRYYGIVLFVVIVFASAYFGYNSLMQAVNDNANVRAKLEQKEKELNRKMEEKKVVERKLAQMREASGALQKRIYAPIDADLGNDTLFFTLYNDLIEMVHSNSIKIKSMEYVYNPENDAFVKFSKDVYFVSEVNMELVSNYTNLGKFIQDVVQYPYYMRIMSIDVKPYPKDKKILISNVSVRMYAKTSPEENKVEEE